MPRQARVIDLADEPPRRRLIRCVRPVLVGEVALPTADKPVPEAIIWLDTPIRKIRDLTPTYETSAALCVVHDDGTVSGWWANARDTSRLVMWAHEIDDYFALECIQARAGHDALVMVSVLLDTIRDELPPAIETARSSEGGLCLAWVGDLDGKNCGVGAKIKIGNVDWFSLDLQSERSD